MRKGILDFFSAFNYRLCPKSREGTTLQTDFETLEKKIIQLIEGYKALKARNEDLMNELRIQGREVEELKRKV
ncbi:hypothetical protein ACFL4G_11525, partial [Thermodesulfobacteriota bacterium]